ncbi:MULTISPECIES: hypothetical protein [unclassified Flavobacterium]|uniref:hypothetical protein n=1 Tax=unclassified Flavobacterium TaxID=196869 RepID=UPI00360E0115
MESNTMLSDNKVIVQISSIGLVVYTVQKILFKILNVDTASFQINLEIIHAIMLVFSLIIMIILNVVFKKNKDVVGMTFLLITSIKVCLIYVIGSYFILDSGNAIEKWNFYGLFVLYLGLETFFTAQRLNRTSF